MSGSWFTRSLLLGLLRDFEHPKHQEFCTGSHRKIKRCIVGVRKSVHAYLTIRESTASSSIPICMNLSIHPSIHPSACLSVCPSIYLSIDLSVHLAGARCCGMLLIGTPFPRQPKWCSSTTPLRRWTVPQAGANCGGCLASWLLRGCQLNLSRNTVLIYSAYKPCKALRVEVGGCRL